jgi:hypothetical protein
MQGELNKESKVGSREDEIRGAVDSRVATVQLRELGKSFPLGLSSSPVK